MIKYTQFPVINKINRLLVNSTLKNLLWMVFFGILALLFGMVRIYIPDTDGAISDLGEIPLFISVFHLTNPLYSIGVSAISAIGTPYEGSYISSFSSHAISLMISWGFIYYLKKQNFTIIIRGVLCMVYIIIYYLLFLIPLIILTNYLTGLNEDKPFGEFYMQTMLGARFEMVSAALIVSLYFIQLSFRAALNLHLENLEETVQTRTSELNAVIEELKTTQQYLVQKEKMVSLGTLTAGIAHEINNPLNFISGSMYLFSEINEELEKTALGDVKDRFGTAFKIMQEGLSRTMGIVNALKTFSMRGPSTLVLSDLHEIIDNTLLFLNYSLPDDVRIEKDFQLKDKIPLYVDKMHQVVMNIIENAIYEFRSEGKVNPVITITTRRSDDFAVLSISNNGKQIPEQIIHQIFDPFFTTKDPGQGVGLGLSIAYAFIQDHGGMIHVRNLDEGVCFEIEFPLVQS